MTAACAGSATLHFGSDDMALTAARRIAGGEERLNR